jgi:2-polyprenyl-6-methoxyphenol hydroxylase-like FAD-dependent oxidoreductase
MKFIVNGAGIAGPTLAYWLRKSGHEVVLVEAAPELRSGGYIIDFWGTGYTIAEKMGILPAVHQHGYRVKEVRFVDSDGRKAGGFLTQAIERLTRGRFTSLRRSDLAKIIFDSLREVDVIFGDSIAAIEETNSGCRVTFEHAAARDCDFVIGADGLHSRVRELAFGAESAFEVKLGYHVAAFEVEGYRPQDELVYLTYGMPGRQISRFSMRDDSTMFLFVFRDEYLPPGNYPDPSESKQALIKIFANTGWETDKILDAMEGAKDIYFDTVSQVHMSHWTKGRVALVGDAAACVSLLAGEGSGLAMTEAYVLAGELSRSGGDFEAAFASYEQRLMPHIMLKQRSAAKFARSFAPATAFGLFLRNWVTKLMRVPGVANYVLGTDLSKELSLPDYRF